MAPNQTRRIVVELLERCNQIVVRNVGPGVCDYDWVR
jgi:hypothetical protein